MKWRPCPASREWSLDSQLAAPSSRTRLTGCGMEMSTRRSRRRGEERGGPGGRGRTRYADTEAPPSLEGVTAGYFEGSAPPPSWPRMDARPLGHSRRWERIWDHWATGCHLESWTPGCRVGGWPGRASVHTAHCAPHTAPQRSGPEGDWRWVGLHGRASGGRIG
jgi:hypothetical protein